MTEFGELLKAAQSRVCPFCSGGLTVRHNGAHYVLACVVCNSQMGSPDDCPNQATLRILEAEAALVTATYSAGERSVASDMVDLYGKEG